MNPTPPPGRESPSEEEDGDPPRSGSSSAMTKLLSQSLGHVRLRETKSTSRKQYSISPTTRRLRRSSAEGKSTARCWKDWSSTLDASEGPKRVQDFLDAIRNTLVSFGVAAVVLLGPFASASLGQELRGSPSEVVSEVISIVEQNYEPVRGRTFDPARWRREAEAEQQATSYERAHDLAKRFLESLGDPYSKWIPPEKFQTLLKYDVSGVGLNFVEDQAASKGLRVLGVVRDSAAEKSGLCVGDEILSIEGNDASSFSAFEAASAIRAKEGTEVTVTIRHQPEWVAENIGASSCADASDSLGAKDITIEKGDTFRENSPRPPVTWRQRGDSVGAHSQAYTMYEIKMLFLNIHSGLFSSLSQQSWSCDSFRICSNPRAEFLG